MAEEIWVIYDHPSDYPQSYVARRWVGLTATNVVVDESLDSLRGWLRKQGLARHDRHAADDPVIMEVWV